MLYEAITGLGSRVENGVLLTSLQDITAYINQPYVTDAGGINYHTLFNNAPVGITVTNEIV